VFEYQCDQEVPLHNVTASFAILNGRGFSLILHRTNFTNQNFSEVPPHGVIRCEIPRLPLVAGKYFIGTYLEVESETADDPGVIAGFIVEEGDFFGTGNPGLPSHSPFLVDGYWTVSSC
jgi:lipopolysaccharide transport system ATP-binding protein